MPSEDVGDSGRGERGEPREGGKAGEAKNHNKYRKDKPWDDPSIDHWSTPEWKDDIMKVTD